MRRLPAELRYASVHATSRQFGFAHDRSEAELASLLSALSAYDCMGMIGRLSSALYVNARSHRPEVQYPLIQWLTGFDPEWNSRLTAVVRAGYTALFPQQLAHLARLVARYAADRPGDEFRDDEGRRKFLAVLLGVPDLLHDSALDLRDRQDRLRWALRHSAIGQNPERLTLWSVYFEVFCRIWPASKDPTMPDADAAFLRYTGMSISRFMAAGLTFSSAFAAQQQNRPGRGYLDPADYFAQTRLPERDWRAFLAVSGTTLADLRNQLAAEEQDHGPTSFGALAYEKSPLLTGPDDRVYLISLASLERRATEGILHLLAEGAVAEGGDREDYTAPFGKAFQQWAEGCCRRATAQEPDPPAIYADASYGTKRQPKQTPDVVLRYPGALVVVEIVSGAMHAATLTHGDPSSFDEDLRKLIEKKARQLTKRVGEILNGDARALGLEPDGIQTVWPVIVTATSFPHRPEIGPVIRRRLKQVGLLRDRAFRTLSIISAEELAAAEGAAEEGTSLPELLAEWKRTPATGDHPFKNHLIFRERSQRRRPAQHHREVYRDACRVLIGEVLDPAQVEEASYPDVGLEN